MSSLWTPGGEHEVPRQTAPQPSPPTPEPGPDGGQSPAIQIDPETAAALEQMSPEERAQAEQMIAEMAQAQAEIARTPAAVVVANHAMGMYELAIIHLRQQPPNLGEAEVAIDGLAALVDKLRGRLGENEATLNQALTQLQTVFVQLVDEARAARSGEGDAG